MDATTTDNNKKTKEEENHRTWLLAVKDKAAVDCIHCEREGERESPKKIWPIKTGYLE